MFGTVAEWLSALAALGALTAAIWAALTSRRLVQVEMHRDVKAADRAAREQASGIAAWCVFCPGNGEDSQAGLLVHNDSDGPVYDVEVHSTRLVKQVSIPQYPLRLSIVPPGDFVATADPKYHWSLPEERGAIGGIVRPVTKSTGWMVTSVTFTDAHGQRWVRDGGRLTRFAEEAASTSA